MSRSQQQSSRPQRDPPPALFLHASPAASHVSLPGTAAGAGGPALTTGLPPSQAPVQGRTNSTLLSHDPIAATLSTLSKPMDGTSRNNSRAAGPGSVSASRRTPALGPGPDLPRLQTTSRRESTRATDRTDALWAEMQATLEEVELSASGGTRVFGPDHDRKLAELRSAQIALAQAWARSEADETIETTGAAGASSASPKAAGTELRTDGTDGTGKSTAATSIRPGSEGTSLGADRLGQKLEQETEDDIQFARKRREANDRYFQRVNQGVLDVVAKLDEVATAMRAVEQESKDVWGDESVPSSARP